jgi:NAD+ synthase (glutamine-hydrolysing)
MAARGRNFLDLYAHGFVRVAIGVPRVALADPARNAPEIARLHAEAAEGGAALALFPELCLSGYSLDDLHQQDALLEAVLAGLASLRESSAGRATLMIVGAPLRLDQRLFNCAVVIARGEVLGVVPKSYLPSYREFYEKRQFAAARDALSDRVHLLGREVPFGNDLIFRDTRQPDFCVGVELCEDLWAPIPPSTFAALRGATVLANLSASNVTVGKAAYRRDLARSQSAKALCAYLYAAAGAGESTTDLAWDGHALVCENGELLAESERFADVSRLLFADVDLERLVGERTRQTSFIDCATDQRAALRAARVVAFVFEPPQEAQTLARAVERAPFVPADPQRRDERCREAYSIQVAGLVGRLRASDHQKVVIGISGGLDSTQALLVCARAMDQLELPRTNILAWTLPGLATSTGTLASARDLMAALGVTAGEIDIGPASERMLADIGHPYAQGEPLHDVTFENVQAGERTSHLFRLANLHRALVIGTGDLSELALGWCTYGVGDHMSHYAANVSVPKTLVRHLIAWVAEHSAEPALASVLQRILATPISPELVPGDDPDAPGQHTEAAIGPFELHDFFLYAITRRGYRPAKTAYLAMQAWAHALPGEEHAPYDGAKILDWLELFLRRFFQNQFKRSAIPNGPKVGSGGSLSPRGDWRAPSDASPAVWLTALAQAREWYERSRQAPS